MFDIFIFLYYFLLLLSGTTHSGQVGHTYLDESKIVRMRCARERERKRGHTTRTMNTRVDLNGHGHNTSPCLCLFRLSREVDGQAR